MTKTIDSRVARPETSPNRAGHPAESSSADGRAVKAAARQLVRAARALFQRGLVVGLDGNLSLRLPDGSLLITPSGAVKGWLRPRDLLHIDLNGLVIEGPEGARPSSETAMHLAAYKARPEIRAVVHAHPPSLVACSALGLPLFSDALPEALLLTGDPIRLPYATPSTTEGAEAVARRVGEGNCFVLERHGSLALGENLTMAFARTESMEQLARFSLLARQLGLSDPAVLALNATQQAALARVREAMGWGGPGAAHAAGSEDSRWAAAQVQP